MKNEKPIPSTTYLCDTRSLGIVTVPTGGTTAGVAGFIVAGVFKGAVIGAVSGAITWTASNVLKVGRAATLWDKGSFKSGFQSMKYHYAKHGAGFGSIVSYSKQATSISIRNATCMTLQNSFTGMQHY